MKIERIETERKRVNCFNKRQPGLLKKAMELSILCDAHVTVLIVGEKGQTFGYSTDPLAQAVAKFTSSGAPLLRNDNYGSSFQKNSAKMALSDDDGDDGDDASGESAPKGSPVDPCVCVCDEERIAHLGSRAVAGGARRKAATRTAKRKARCIPPCLAVFADMRWCR